MGARNIALALTGTAHVMIVLPREAVMSDHDLEPFSSVHRLPIANLKCSVSGAVLYFPKLIAASWAIGRILRREKCQHLILNDFYLMHGVLCRLFGYHGRIVSWVRMDPLIFGQTLAKAWMQLTHLTADEIVAVSKYIARRIAPFAGAHILYDPWIAPDSNHASAPAERPRLLYVANYIPGKGQPEALEAFAQIADAYPASVLEFWGGDMGLAKNSAFRASLEWRAKILGISGRVVFNGFAGDPAVVLKGAFLALNFSGNESFSMTVLEAGAAGLPVIATRCGGPEEIVEDGVTGLLVPVSDTAAMAAAMQSLLSDPGRARAMGVAARRHIRKSFDFEQFRRNLLAILYLKSGAVDQA